MAKKNDVNLNDLSTWPLLMTVLFALIIAVAVIYLAKMILIDNISDEVRRKDSEIVKEEKLYAENKRIVAQLPHIRQEVEQLTKIRNDLTDYLPTKVSMPSLIDNVYLAARSNGIVFDQFTPEEDIEKEYYTIKPISLEAKVGYISMSSFIEEVTTLKRIMNVDSVNFHVEEDDNEHKSPNVPLTMKAQLRTYIFKDSLPAEPKK